MKGLQKVAILMVLLAGTSLLGTRTAKAEYWKDACPSSSGLGGWWGTIYPSTRICSNDYYTWNNQTIASEESSYKSGAHAIFCGYVPPPITPYYGQARVYIPSPDSRQTSYAHYYQWSDSTHYVAIGIVNQYNSFGWVYLNRVDWYGPENFKVSDVTSPNEARYSKHMDLDAFSLTCP